MTLLPVKISKKLNRGRTNIQLKILMNLLAILMEDPNKMNLWVKRFISKISNSTPKLMNTKEI